MKVNEQNLVKVSSVFALCHKQHSCSNCTAFKEHSAQCGKKFLSSLRKRTATHHDSS